MLLPVCAIAHAGLGMNCPSMRSVPNILCMPVYFIHKVIAELVDRMLHHIHMCTQSIMLV